MQRALLFTTVIMSVMIFTNFYQGFDFDKAWAEYERNIADRKPKSAYDNTVKIFEAAQKENNSPQKLKAIVKMSELAIQLNEEGLVWVEDKLRDEIQSSKAPEKEILQSILAKYYFDYLQEGSYEIDSRTNRPDTGNESMDTYTRMEFQALIEELFLASIQEKMKLSVPIGNYDILLRKKERTLLDLAPNLYYILAHRALDYFRSTGWSSFNIEAISYDDYLVPTNEFLQLQYAEENTTSSKKVMWLYREMMELAKINSHSITLATLDLGRLQLIYQNSVGVQKDSIYKEILKSEAVNYQTIEQYSEFAAALASRYYDESNFIEAKAWAEKAMEAWPDSYGAFIASNTYNRIVERQLEIVTEKIFPTRESILFKLRYKNLDDAYIRLIRLDESMMENFNRANSENRRSLLMGMKPIEELSYRLKNSGDYTIRESEFEMKSPQYGHYSILVSNNSDFSELTSYANFIVSDLSVAQINGSTNLELIVQDRTLGSPKPKVKISIFKSEFDTKSRTTNRVLTQTLLTDKEGIISAPIGIQSFQIRLEDGKDIQDGGWVYLPSERVKRGNRRVNIFTDRAIYRPGQVVYFKVLDVEYDQNNQPVLLQGNSLEISFRDANFQDIEKTTLRFNEFGSASGSFTIPTGLLTGNFTLRTPFGAHSIRVEEYKRPAFEVEIDSMKGTFSLNDSIPVTGKAKAFAGFGIGNSEFTYTVNRLVNYWPIPWKLRLQYPIVRYNPELVSSGSGTTDAQGNFNFEFVAISTPKNKLSQYIRYTYEVEVRVTDQTGETHSRKQYYNFSELPFSLEIQAPKRADVKDFKTLSIKALNASGSEVEASGKIEVYSLKTPDKLLKNKYWSYHDTVRLQNESSRAGNDFLPEESTERRPERDNLIFSSDFFSGTAINMNLLSEGIYEIVASSTTGDGKEIEQSKIVTLTHFAKNKFPRTEALFLDGIKKTYQTGEDIIISLGTPEKRIWAYILLSRGDQILRKQWIRVRKNDVFKYRVDEADRGGLTLQIHYVYENRSYSIRESISVPYSNKELAIEFESFRDKLLPGQEEEYRIKIKSKFSDKIVAEMLAAMYDASLDQFTGHFWSKPQWPQNFSYFAVSTKNFESTRGIFIGIRDKAAIAKESVFPSEWPQLIDVVQYSSRLVTRTYSRETAMSPASKSMEDDGMLESVVATMDAGESPEEEQRKAYFVDNELTIDNSEFQQGQVRTILNETVFFLPHLRTDDEGNIVFSFKMNEALTRWKLMSFVHTQDLKMGYEERFVETSKDLMIIPNKPRYFREGDELYFAARVVNLTDKEVPFVASLHMEELVKGTKFDSWIIDSEGVSGEVLKAGETRLVRWKISVPQGVSGALKFRMMARSEGMSDGEEDVIPLVSNKILLTESLPMFVRPGQKRTYQFDRFLSGQSQSRVPVAYTFELSSNPVWYVIQALPYMNEISFRSADMIFHRLYANSISKGIVDANPIIRDVMKQWMITDSDQLLSNIEKNQELKNSLLEETPWVMDAIREGYHKQNIAMLFDDNNIRNKQEDLLRELERMQLPNGGFPWFPGGRASMNTTMQIVEGINYLLRYNLNQPGLETRLSIIRKNAMLFINEEMNKSYHQMIQSWEGTKVKKDEYKPGFTELWWLYLHSELKEDDMKEGKEAYEFYIKQTRKNFLRDNLYLQALTGFVLHRDGDKNTKKIVESLKERAVYKQDLGAYWNAGSGFHWSELPIERHAMLIMMFVEIDDDEGFVEDLKIWLLRHKQVNSWGTHKATAIAIHSFMIQKSGNIKESALKQTQPMIITFGDMPYQYDTQDAAVGYYKRRWESNDVTENMASITIENPNEKLAWASSYWQYLEDMDKAEIYNETPLNIQKELYKEVQTSQGKILERIKEEERLAPGQIIVSRLIIRSEQDMSYIHVKDMRPGGFEPINVLSGYKWSHGLGYYESTRDLASHFFINNLPKGTHVFEHRMIATHSGAFSSGPAFIQSVYAPEFGGFSGGERVEVGN
jgi:phage pi2 protein 07